MRGAGVAGQLDLNSREPRIFSPEEVRWLETVAAQVAVALENARLYQDTLARSQELEVLFEAGHAMSARELARLTCQITRHTEIVARYGGEEFAVILPKTDGAEATAHNILLVYCFSSSTNNPGNRRPGAG